MPSRRGVHLEPLDPKIVKMLDLQSNILERLRAKLDLDKIPMERLHEEDLWQRAERATIDLVETLETSGELPKYIDQDTLIKETLNEALALGPLEDLLADEKIDEIIIDRRDRVVVGKDGQLRGSGKAFSSDDVFERVVKRLVAEAGARIDDAHPIVDLRMRDGTRLTARVPPVAARGACLVLKKAASADAAARGSRRAERAVRRHGRLPRDLRHRAPQHPRVRWPGLGQDDGRRGARRGLAGRRARRSPSRRSPSSRSRATSGSSSRRASASARTRDVDLAALLETALRLAPDRLVVGEVRGREALPLVQRAQRVDRRRDRRDDRRGRERGADPARHARRVARRRRRTAAIRELVAQAFEIVVHVVALARRLGQGARRSRRSSAVTDTTFDTAARCSSSSDGSFVATGKVPRFYAELEARGIPADQAVFR